MRTCRRGHVYRGDENYRARQGSCPVCFAEVSRRYNQSDKNKENQARYYRTDKGQARHDRYKSSPKGWKNALDRRRSAALKRRANRVTD